MNNRKATILGALLPLAGFGVTAQTPSPAPGTSVVIASFTYTPAKLSVPVGTTIRFRNDDTDAHTVTADNGSWDSGGMDPHAVFTYTFTKPGTYTYACALHPWMRGVIVVTAPQ